MRPLVQSGGGNSKFSVEALRSSSGCLSYAIRDKRSGEVVRKVASSYQTDEGELPNWSFNHTSRAQAYWNDKGDLVAIDEAAHNFEGTVLIVMFEKGRSTKLIDLPEARLLAVAGKGWDKYRFSCEDGWSGARRLALTLVAQRGPQLVRMVIPLTIQLSGEVVIGKPVQS